MGEDTKSREWNLFLAGLRDWAEESRTAIWCR